MSKNKKPTGTTATSRIDLQTQKLLQLLAPEPVLREKLLEALETKAWFVTISMQKRLKPDDPHDLQHFQISMGYPPGDLVSSLKTIARDITARRNPAGETGQEGGWV